MIPRLGNTRWLGQCFKNLSGNLPHRAWPGTSKSGSTSYVCVRRNSCVCNDPDVHPLVYHQLSTRSLVQVSGADSANFLQGLITNDMTLLDGPLHAMYAMMLNVQGRVLYDLIVYNKGKTTNTPSYLLECDSEVTSELVSLLKKYKIRKKVDLFDVSDTYKVWSVLPEEDGVPMEKLPVNLSATEPVVFSVLDPRLPTFSHRLVLLQGISASKVLEKAEETNDGDFYKRRRYQLGLGEGITDLPPANSFPLECNAAFLNGVSFSKGCYVGQELTARTHHTGVIRKRLMPFTFNSDDHGASRGDKVENEKGKNCGKIRDFVGKDGLALVRVAECVGKRSVKWRNEDGTVTGEGRTHIPPWWPVETDEIMRQVTGIK